MADASVSRLNVSLFDAGKHAEHILKTNCGEIASDGDKPADLELQGTAADFGTVILSFRIGRIIGSAVPPRKPCREDVEGQTPYDSLAKCSSN